jgi:FAD/FMN-containing dehydrogenase
MQRLLTDLGAIFDGEISTSSADRTSYSHDASIYELLPEAVLFPRTSKDIQKLVKHVNKVKHSYPALSITARGAGTDMSGGAIGNSLVLDMTRHFNTLQPFDGNVIHTQPGVYMREIDAVLKADYLIGCVPASRALCTIGGMVGNNSGGERSLQYGNAEESVRQLQVIFADGNEYTVAPLNRRELAQKIKQGDFEGELYRKVYQLIEANYDLIKNARPRVRKNSMGYNLWSVWDRDTGIFDLTRLITGSQGTLGIVTDIKIQAHRKAPHNGLVVAYVDKPAKLEKVIQTVMKHRPVTFEGFDDITFSLGIKYFKSFRQQLGTKEWLKQQTMLAAQAARFRAHLPSVVLMIEFDGETIGEIDTKIAALQKDLSGFKLKTTVEHDDADSALFWNIRRASLSLLRNRVHNKYASPFIDDLTVRPRYIHKFLPEIREIIRTYKLPATVAGHFGDGNFHIIPLMDIENKKDQAKLEPVMRAIVPIIKKYGGTLAGEHNDGMVRGPWLPAMFGDDVYQLFRQTKEIFDPMYIFNPHKKTDASWDFSMDHIRTSETNPAAR